LGGPIVTEGGVVFIGAAMDNYLRAFDAETGEELWKGRLPAGGQATPMTYRTQTSFPTLLVMFAALALALLLTVARSRASLANNRTPTPDPGDKGLS
jgi:PQQ enzyme repeat